MTAEEFPRRRDDIEIAELKLMLKAHTDRYDRDYDHTQKWRHDLASTAQKQQVMLEEAILVQAGIKVQINGLDAIHHGIKTILDRHDLLLIGDGSEIHPGLSGRVKVLEDYVKDQKSDKKFIWGAIIVIFLERAKAYLFGGK